MTSEGPHDDAGHDPAHSAPPVVRGAASVPGRAPDQADEAGFPPQTFPGPQVPSPAPVPPAVASPAAPPPSFPGFQPAQPDRDAPRGGGEWDEPRGGRRQEPGHDPNDYFAPARPDSAGGFPPVEPTQAFPPPSPEFAPAREFPPADDLRPPTRPVPPVEEFRTPPRAVPPADDFRAPPRAVPPADEFRAPRGFPAAPEFAPSEFARPARDQQADEPDQPADRGFGPLERTPRGNFDAFAPPPAAAKQEFGGFDPPRDDAEREPESFPPPQEPTVQWSDRARHSAEPAPRAEDPPSRPAGAGLRFDGPAGYPEDAGPYADEPGRYADPSNLPRRTPADPSSLPPKPERPAAVAGYPPLDSPVAAPDSPAPGLPRSLASGFAGAGTGVGAGDERGASAFAGAGEDRPASAGPAPYRADPYPVDRPQRHEPMEHADRGQPSVAAPSGHREAEPSGHLDAEPAPPRVPSADPGQRDRFPDPPVAVPQQRPPVESAAGDFAGRGPGPVTGRAVSASASVPVASRVSPQDGPAVLPQGRSAPQPRVYGSPVSPPAADPAERPEAAARQFGVGSVAPEQRPSPETPGRFPAGPGDPRFPDAGSAHPLAGLSGRPAVDQPGAFRPDEVRPGGFPDDGAGGLPGERPGVPGQRSGGFPGGGPAGPGFPGGPPDHTRAGGLPPYAEADAPPRPAGGVYGTAAPAGHPGHPGHPDHPGGPGQFGHPGGPGQPGQPVGFPATGPHGAMIPTQPAGPSGGWPAEDGRLDDPSFGEFRSDDGASAEPEPVPQVRNGRVLLAVLSGAALLLVLPFLIVWMATRNSADPGFDVGSCVKESGSTAVAVDCADGGAFRVVSKVADKAECPDRNQPSLLMPDSNGRDRVLCLRPAAG
jgi:hypothetical protein